jgi:hypothetical protein
MQQVFLSFTYNPHPDYTAETELLHRRVSIVIEALDLRVVTGEDLGGEALTEEVKARIKEADALVAVISPWKDARGQKTQPQWVIEEFAHAKALGKPAIRLLHSEFAAAGMYAANEYIPVQPDNPTEALLKLLKTVALWKKDGGRPIDIEISPDIAGTRFEPANIRRCEFQLFINYRESDWRPATVWPQPGAMYAHLNSVPDQAKLRLRLELGNETWESAFHNPVGRVQLSRNKP